MLQSYDLYYLNMILKNQITNVTPISTILHKSQETFNMWILLTVTSHTIVKKNRGWFKNESLCIEIVINHLLKSISIHWYELTREMFKLLLSYYPIRFHKKIKNSKIDNMGYYIQPCSFHFSDFSWTDSYYTAWQVNPWSQIQL